MTAQAAPRQTTPEAQSRYDEHKAIKAANKSANQSVQWRDADEARQQMMVPLDTGKKYVFRSKQGTHRGFSPRIPSLPVDFRTELQRDVLTKRFNKRREEIVGEGDKFDIDSVREKVGGDYIQFKPIPGRANLQTTCFYATDDDEVYEYMMSRVRSKRGGWQHIIVEYPTRMVEINGQKFPATDAGAEAAKAAFMAEVPA